MAKTKPNSLIDSLSGKLCKQEDIVNRYRFGVNEAYRVNPEAASPRTQAQQDSSSTFARASVCASIINKNADLKAPFQTLFLQQYRNARSRSANRSKTRKPVSRTTASGKQSRPYSGTPQILYRFILSTLNSDPALLAQYESLLFPDPTGTM